MNSDCEINRWTRSGCLACRLKKCFSLGMNPQLIRAQPGKPPSRAIAKLTPCLPKVVYCCFFSSQSHILSFSHYH